MKRVSIKCCICLAVISACALTMNYPIVLDIQKWSIAATVKELRYSLDGTSVLSSAICLLMASFGMRKKQWVYSRGVAVFSAIMSGLWLMARSISETGSLDLVFCNPAQIVKSVIYFVGMTWMLFMFGQLLNAVLSAPMASVSTKESRCNKWQFICDMGLVFTAWIPYLILDFPGRIAWDSWRELNMFYGLEPITAQHPPVHTILIGSFVQFGKWLGNGNIGILLFVLLQMIMFSAIIAYELKIMKELGAPKWLQSGLLIAAMFSMVYAYYSVEILKDCQYAHFFLLFIIECIRSVIGEKTYFSSMRNLFLLCISICGVLLFRKNGKYVIILFVLFTSIVFFFDTRKYGLIRICRKWLRPFTVVLIAFVLSGILENAIIDQYSIKPGSMRELFSLPFQQTARFARDNEEKITSEEAAAISSVIDYENLSELYNPTISDPVKNTFRSDVTYYELMGYFKAWMIQFIKSPITYVEATVQQTYPLWYPFEESHRGRYATRFIESFEEVIEESDYLVAGIIEDGHQIAQEIAVLLYRIPVLGLFSSQAVYTIVLLFMVLFAFLDKRKKTLYIMIPVLLSILVVFVSPVVVNHERYAFSFMYAAPILMAYYHYDQIDKQENNSEEIVY